VLPSLVYSKCLVGVRQALKALRERLLDNQWAADTTVEWKRGPGGTSDLYDLLGEVDPEGVVDLVRAERASESEKHSIDNGAMAIS